jgi:hypothetical protein
MWQRSNGRVVIFGKSGSVLTPYSLGTQKMFKGWGERLSVVRGSIFADFWEKVARLLAPAV